MVASDVHGESLRGKLEYHSAPLYKLPQSDWYRILA